MQPDYEAEEAVQHQLNVEKTEFTAPYIDHWVVQTHGVAPELLDDTEKLKTLLNGVVESLELTAVSDHSHYFGPGVSTVIILSESHLSAHTWPENGYMHVDIVTCEEKINEDRLRAVFARAFAPEKIQLSQLVY